MRRYRGTDLARRYRRSVISPTSWRSDWLVADNTQCALCVNHMQDARRCKLGVAEGELGRGDSNAVFSPSSIHTQLPHYRLTYICTHGACTQGCSSRQTSGSPSAVTLVWHLCRQSCRAAVEWVMSGSHSFPLQPPVHHPPHHGGSIIRQIPCSPACKRSALAV